VRRLENKMIYEVVTNLYQLLTFFFQFSCLKNIYYNLHAFIPHRRIQTGALPLAFDAHLGLGSCTATNRTNLDLRFDIRTQNLIIIFNMGGHTIASLVGLLLSLYSFPLALVASGLVGIGMINYTINLSYLLIWINKLIGPVAYILNLLKMVPFGSFNFMN